MRTEPGHEMAAGRGGLRTSGAEREQAIEVLKAAFVQGRLAKDEFVTRVGHAFTSRTRAELAALTADLPAGLAAAGPVRGPARTGRRTNAIARTGAGVITVATAVTAASWAGASSGPDALLLAWTFTMIWLGTLLLTLSVMIDSRRRDRTAGRLPPPGADRKTSLGY